MKNPGPGGGAWTEHLIDAIGPPEFAFLVDLDNDGKADDLLPQFTGAAGAPLTWYGLKEGKWIKHVVSDRRYGHGISAGDVNGDGRNDILTTQGWLEAPVDPRAPDNWTFHATDWQQRPIPAPAPVAFPSLTTPPATSCLFCARSQRGGLCFVSHGRGRVRAAWRRPVAASEGQGLRASTEADVPATE